MAIEIIMPKLGLTMETGTISSWLFKEGERVQAGEALLSIETDKVTIDVEAPASGVLLKIIELQGSSVPVAQVIGFIGEPGEDLPELKQPPEKTIHETPPSSLKQAASTAEPDPSKPVAISPIARKLAAQHRIDYSRLTGSGPGGRIVEADILGQLEQQPSPAEPPYELKPLSSLQKLAALRMSQSAHDAPHFYLKREVIVDELVKLRERLLPEYEQDQNIRLTFTDLMLKSTAAALVEHPYLNASWDDGAVRLYQTVNMGLAVATQQGLVVVVIKNAQKKSLAEISTERKQLTEKAQSGKLSRDDISAGTFTLTNLGMLGIDEFFPIINPPQSAILAVGSITEKPVAKQHEIVLCQTMQVTLAADHRVVDGAMGAAFLAALAHMLSEKPDKIF